MHKNDIYILLLALLLICAMLITYFLGGDKSRHGTGADQWKKTQTYGFHWA